ncbi:MAG: hypothetical protein JWP69_298 [Flaviaesturariibacter sp.]|nr:hypothetical protein [Flaviaesturariibacter sp.]
MKLEDITSRFNSEEGWNDIFLKIINQRDNKESVIYIAQGLYNEQIVGLSVEVRKNMAAGLLPSGEINQDAFYRDGIKFFSNGQESDTLLKALSTLYQFPTSNTFSKTIEGEGAMTFSLNELPVDLCRREHYKFKLFFHDNSEDLYCEIFCNIDLTKNIIELHEKDEEYRENIIRTFASELQ